MLPTLRNHRSRSMRSGDFMQDWVNEFFGDLAPWSNNGWSQRGMFAPLSHTDVYQQDGFLVYETELPGITRDQLNVRLEGDHLIVSGEVKRGNDVDQSNYLSMGRRYGQFQRAFRLPAELVELDPKGIRAELDHGVLSISLPLKEEAQPKPIDIQVS